MAKQIKVTEVDSGEVFWTDEDNFSGPIEVKKPENYITPDQVPGARKKLFSKSKKSHVSHSKKLEIAERLYKELKENGYPD